MSDSLFATIEAMIDAEGLSAENVRYLVSQLIELACEMDETDSVSEAIEATIPAPWPEAERFCAFADADSRGLTTCQHCGSNTHWHLLGALYQKAVAYHNLELVRTTR